MASTSPSPTGYPAPQPPYPPSPPGYGMAPQPYAPPASDPRRWVYGALAALLVLVGISIFLGTLASAHAGHVGPGSLIVLVLVLFFLFLFVGAAAMAIRWSGRGARGSPWGGAGGMGHGAPWMGRDSAVIIVRERFARGEITREQFDQLIQGLDPYRSH
jgi:hypothetical protein